MCLAVLAMPVVKGLGYKLDKSDRLLDKHLCKGLVSTATINPVLTSRAVKFMQDAGKFVGTRLAPYFFTAEKSADYYVTSTSDQVSVPVLKAMSPGAVYGRTYMRLSDDTYNCKKYGHELPVADEERKRYAKSFDADKSAVDRDLNIIRINHELRVKNSATGAGVSSSVPAVKWDDYANALSVPHTNVEVAREIIYDKTGMDPNVMVLPRQVFNKLKYHPALRALLGDTNVIKKLTIEQLATIFEIPEILVPGGLINGAADGQAMTISKIWSDSVVLAHVNTSQDLQALNFLRTFVWTGMDGGGDRGTLVKSYREENADQTVHQIKHFTDEKIVGVEAGYHLSDVLI